MATKLHDCDLFFDFVLLAPEVVGDGQVRPRARDPFPLELVEPVGAGVVARHDFDSLRKGNVGNKHALGKWRERRTKMEG